MIVDAVTGVRKRKLPSGFDCLLSRQVMVGVSTWLNGHTHATYTMPYTCYIHNAIHMLYTEYQSPSAHVCTNIQTYSHARNTLPHAVACTTHLTPPMLPTHQHIPPRAHPARK